MHLSQGSLKICLNRYYHNYLFKKNIVSTFEDSNGNRFVGKIIKVTSEGKLKVQLENDSEIDFDIKEVKMLY